MGQRAELVYQIIEKTHSGAMTWEKFSIEVSAAGESSPDDIQVVEVPVWYFSDPKPLDSTRWTFKVYKKLIGARTYNYILQIFKIAGSNITVEFVDDEQTSVKALWDQLNREDTMPTRNFIDGLIGNGTENDPIL